ncbi:hypothetical protein GLAREA_12404 [Glarea lozoyensis ATCC 20868]|uniref:rRNA biogenesis protein RRP36 n=1 Tax=Glarea lozoyensis (strain ATCC 20868 / MF5171) TaxID=1116229 RepID=S3DZ91_GLAL2|nr:uncharacterized protein GLAREA_12404 [Glarea lozoyensis ATCC 20868]EPE31648.1 hypothetical protein GLAREA_12404 [Glarea lozoyensis ATCC 20868]
MSSTKRKAIDTSLERRVRARREESVDIEDITSSSEASGEDRNEETSASDEDGGVESDASSEPEPLEAASISFGALAKASATLTNPKSKKKKTTDPQEPTDTWTNAESLERKAGRQDHRDFNRSSKHAPTEISSKKAVSRRREVVPVPKREFRDPRFDSVTGYVDEAKVRKAYGFLDEYREAEMKELKEKIRQSKDEDEKERLKRTLESMESRKKAQARKDKAAEVLDRHRKEEKELVKQGKKPFYLKKGEQKKRVLVEQYAGLKGKQLDHVMERRRKKVEGKEKKKMPWSRRETGT